jgi:L-ascorbate metabolism protein UlaG (beta-lactamase superfamily)
VIVPRGAGRLMAQTGFTNAVELPVGESIHVGDVRVTATPASHAGFRPPFGPTAEAIGYLLDHDNERVYFAGDTDLFPEMADLAGIDLALLPVWGWGPRLGPGHMDPKRAAEALQILRPTAAVPIHWGTLWPIGMGRVMPHLLEGPPLDFARYAAVLAPEVQILLTPPGATVPIPR